MAVDDGEVEHDLGPPILVVCPKCDAQCIRHPAVEDANTACWRCLTPLLWPVPKTS